MSVLLSIVQISLYVSMYDIPIVVLNFIAGQRTTFMSNLTTFIIVSFKHKANT